MDTEPVITYQIRLVVDKAFLGAKISAHRELSLGPDVIATAKPREFHLASRRIDVSFTGLGGYEKIDLEIFVDRKLFGVSSRYNFQCDYRWSLVQAPDRCMLRNVSQTKERLLPTTPPQLWLCMLDASWGIYSPTGRLLIDHRMAWKDEDAAQKVEAYLSVFGDSPGLTRQELLALAFSVVMGDNEEGLEHQFEPVSTLPLTLATLGFPESEPSDHSAS